MFQNFNIFGSCIIHILYTGCAKIEKNNSGAKKLKTETCRSDIIVYFNVNLKLLTELINSAFVCECTTQTLRRLIPPITQALEEQKLPISFVSVCLASHFDTDDTVETTEGFVTQLANFTSANRCTNLTCLHRHTIRTLQ